MHDFGDASVRRGCLHPVRSRSHQPTTEVELRLIAAAANR